MATLNMPFGAVPSSFPASSTPWSSKPMMPFMLGLDTASVTGLDAPWAHHEDADPTLPGLTSPGVGPSTSLLSSAEFDPAALDVGFGSPYDPSTSQASNGTAAPVQIASIAAWPGSLASPFTTSLVPGLPGYHHGGVPSVLAAGPSPLSSPAASTASAGPLLSPPAHQAAPGSWSWPDVTAGPHRADQPDSLPFGLEQAQMGTSNTAGFPQLHAAMGLQEDSTPSDCGAEKNQETSGALSDQQSPFKSVPSIGKKQAQSASSSKARSKASGHAAAGAGGASLLPKNYACTMCGAAFARNHDLRRHARIHMATKPYSCPTCAKQFSRKDAMSRHLSVKSGCLRARRDYISSSTTPVAPPAMQPVESTPGHLPVPSTSVVHGEYKAYNLARRPSTAPGPSANMMPDWPLTAPGPAQAAGPVGVPPYTTTTATTGPAGLFPHGPGTAPAGEPNLLSGSYGLASPFDATYPAASRSRAATVSSSPADVLHPFPGAAPTTMWPSDAAMPRSTPLEEPSSTFLFGDPATWGQT